MSNLVKAEIRAATAHLNPSAFEDEVLDGPAISGPVLRQLTKKADKTDLDAVFNMKASKVDSEMALRQIEILHKQLK